MVILIDIYALFGWFGIITLSSKVLFHEFTELLALPAGIFLIYLSRIDIGKKWSSRLLLVMGLANIFIDGLLFLTWL